VNHRYYRWAIGTRLPVNLLTLNPAVGAPAALEDVSVVLVLDKLLITLWGAA
jgi:hypothetical protein